VGRKKAAAGDLGWQAGPRSGTPAQEAFVEKLFYALWKPEGVAVEELRGELLGPAARRLGDLGASRIKVLLADAFTEPAAPARIARTDPPIVGGVSFWLDCVDDRGPHEAVLEGLVPRHAGYLVSESVPIANRSRRAPPGERTPGTTLLTFIERPERLSEAVTDPMLWYRAEGSKEKLRENMGRMLASVRTFLDIDHVESLPMSEYVLDQGGAP
jgi:hypothetical protein